MKLSDNIVLITGGATGIGLALAEAFLAEGSAVVICGRRQSRLEEAKAKHPQLHTKACDVADDTARRDLVAWLEANFPRLNILINNAGLQRDIDFTRALEDFLSGENEIRTNLESPIILTGLLVPLLAHNTDAAVINVSSGLGFIPAVKMPVYSASKAGLHAWSMAIRPQLAKVGIKVFEVVPPMVDTELNPEGRAKHGDFKADLTAEEFVAAVMAGLKADVPEIGYGTSAHALRASREQLDKAFEAMNTRM